MEVEVALLISVVSVVFSVYFGLKNNKRTDTKDIEDRVARDTKTDMKLDEISRGVQDIKYDVSSVKKDLSKHNDRLIVLENSVEKANGRIDVIEEKMNGGGRNE